MGQILQSKNQSFHVIFGYNDGAHSIHVKQWFSNYEVGLPGETWHHVKGGVSCESFFFPSEERVAPWEAGKEAGWARGSCRETQIDSEQSGSAHRAALCITAILSLGELSPPGCATLQDLYLLGALNSNVCSGISG